MRKILFILFLSLSVNISKAQEISLNEAYSLGTIIINASDNFSFSDPFSPTEFKFSPIFSSILQRKNFAEKNQDLPEILEKQSGIQIRETGGIGSFSTISLRGSESEQVMIFLDGILLNDASGGIVDLSNISLSDIESIQIFKGITPVEFGKASIGGVINIVTRKGQKGFKGNVLVGYGSFDTKKTEIFMNYKPNKWDYLLTASLLDSRNNFKFINDHGTTYNTEDDTVEERHNNALLLEDVLLKIGYDVDKNYRLEFMNQWFFKNKELPDINNSKYANTYWQVKRNITNLRLSIIDKIPNFKTYFNINHLWKWELYDDSEGWIGLGKQKNIYKTERYTINCLNKLYTQKNIFTVNLNFFIENYSTKFLLQPQNPNDSDRRFFSFALQDSLFLFKDNLILTPGIRYSWIKDHLRSATSIWGESLPSETKESSYLQPQIGLKYNFSSNLVFKTNLAQYVREPTFFELFGDRGFFLGNEDLKAEHGLNFDMGFIYHKNFGLKASNKLRLESCFFESQIKDLITQTFDSRGVGKFVNISNALIYGMEIDFNINFSKFLQFISKFNFQTTENKSSIPLFNGKELPGRFQSIYINRLEFHIHKAKLFIENTIKKHMYYDTANLLPAKDRYLINIGFSSSFKKHIKLTFLAQNITDQQYEDFNGYPLPGRSFFVSLSFYSHEL